MSDSAGGEVGDDAAGLQPGSRLSSQSAFSAGVSQHGASAGGHGDALGLLTEKHDAHLSSSDPFAGTPVSAEASSRRDSSDDNWGGSAANNSPSAQAQHGGESSLAAMEDAYSGDGGGCGENGCAKGNSESARAKSERQEATALVMDKALKSTRKTAERAAKMRDDAKNHLKMRAKFFLGCLLGRPELAESMDARNVEKAVDQWVPREGDVGEQMRSFHIVSFLRQF